MAEQAALVLGLVVVTLVAMYSRNKGVIATSVVLSVSWLLNTVVCNATGINYPYGVFMFTDWLAGVLVVAVVPLYYHKFPKLGQIIVAAIYAVQVVWHVCYMWSSQGKWIEYVSWWFLYYTAWAQLLTVGIWLCVMGVHRHLFWSFVRIPLDQAVRTRGKNARDRIR